MTPESRSPGPIGKERKTKYRYIVKFTNLTLSLILGNIKPINLKNS